MAANVETMFSVREVPWHRLGNIVSNALTSKEAIIAAGMNWEVVQEELTTTSGIKMDGYFANVRSDNRYPLGIVTKRYKIVQNIEAFEFTDSLFGDEGVLYETAGVLNHGKSIWCLAKMPDTEIAGDKVNPYLVLTTSHDGKNAIRAAVTPIRVVCQNTLNLALSKAARSWSIRHTGDLKGKMIEARRTLQLAKQYMLDLTDVGNRLVKEKVDGGYVWDMTQFLFPVDKDDSQRIKTNQQAQQNDFLFRLQNAPDLSGIRDTKWGLIQAASDTATHSKPLRETENYWENGFAKLLNGHDVIDRAYEYVLRK